MDVNGSKHNLAFVQHSKIVEHSSSIYHKPLLELEDSYNLISTDAIDQMVEFKPKRGKTDQFYLCITVENY